MTDSDCSFHLFLGDDVEEEEVEEEEGAIGDGVVASARGASTTVTFVDSTEMSASRTSNLIALLLSSSTPSSKPFEPNSTNGEGEDEGCRIPSSWVFPGLTSVASISRDPLAPPILTSALA